MNYPRLPPQIKMTHRYNYHHNLTICIESSPISIWD